VRGTIAWILLALASTGVARADVRAGEAAYDRGDYSAAFEEWQRPAEEGDAEAQYGLGRLYFYGQGVDQDYSKAAKWYRKAALQNHARSQANLGHLYEAGLGVEQDFAEAARWYRAAAEQGRAVAQRGLGRLYEEGRGVEQSRPEAVRWYQLAAEQGDGEARSALDRIEAARPTGAPVAGLEIGAAAYDRGDYTTALATWTALAETGDAEAEYRLGGLYRTGLGVTLDLAEAGKWYQRAADRGHGEAMYHLGFLYLRGRGVSRRVEYGLAHGWFSLAAERGVGDAAAWRDRIARKLTPKEREQSAKLVELSAAALQRP